MALIPITGVPSSFVAPGTYVEILFAQGASSAAAGARECLFIMPMLASGANWTAGVVYGPIRNEQEAIDGAGQGSPLHRALRRALRANPNAKYYALPYAPSTGGTPVAATATATFTTDPTATGVARVWVCGELCSYAFTSSDTVTSVAAGLKASINNKPWLPITADNSSGELTVTARVAGISQGDGTTGAIRWRAEVDLGKGISVATSGKALGIGTGTAGVDGDTTEAAQLLAALATITGRRFYYMGVSVWDATSLGHVKTHLANKGEPKIGLRSVAIAAYEGTLANLATLTTALNYERIQVGWQEYSDDDPCTIAANLVAVRQKKEELRTQFNFDDYREPDWLVPAQADSADWPDLDDFDDAITDGATPIASDSAGSKIVYSAGTRSKDASGSIDDFRILETHRVSVADEWADTLVVRHKLNFSGKSLKDDERLPNGEVNFNQKIGPFVVTPSVWKGLPVQLLNEFEDAGKIHKVAESKASLNVGVDPQNGGRLEAGIDLNVINLLHQLTLRIAETTTG